MRRLRSQPITHRLRQTQECSLESLLIYIRAERESLMNLCSSRFHSPIPERLSRCRTTLRQTAISTPARLFPLTGKAGALTFETFHASLFSWIVAHLDCDGGPFGVPSAVGRFSSRQFHLLDPLQPGWELFRYERVVAVVLHGERRRLYPKYLQDLPVPGLPPSKDRIVLPCAPWIQ